MSASPPTQVLLLRGVNVGGHHKLPMATLRAVLEDLGGTEVRTYIQSGNAVLRADPAGLAERVEAALEAAVGFSVPVMVREGAAVQALAQGHPLAGEGLADKLLYVAFLSRTPDPEAVAALDPDRSPPDRYVVRGSELFVAFPGGMARSRLTADWVDRRLGVTSTWRNLATVRALAGLVAASHAG